MVAVLAVVAVVFAGLLLRMHAGTRATTGLPAGHPESLTTELTPTEEALLARYDAELWPEEAK
jgi:hypothetical protein